MFTVPILFRVESLKLWDSGHFLSQAGPAETEEPNLVHPLSDRAFLALHRGEIGHAYTFLEHVRAIEPDLPVYVTPSILPRADQKKLVRAWRRRHAVEMAAVQDQLTTEFGAICIRQPDSTRGAEWTTLPGFAANDIHHFTVAFVQALAEETAFGEITRFENTGFENTRF